MRALRWGAFALWAGVVAAGILWATGRLEWPGEDTAQELEAGWRERTLREAYQPLFKHHDFIVITRNLTPEQRTRQMRQLELAGLMRVEDRVVVRRTRIYRGALEAATEPICAILARGASPAERTNVGILLVNELGPEELKAWADITVLAILSELHRLPESRPTTDEVQVAVNALLISLPPEERGLVQRALTEPAALSDAEVCRASRTFHRAVLALPAQLRARLARALAR